MSFRYQPDTRVSHTPLPSKLHELQVGFSRRQLVSSISHCTHQPTRWFHFTCTNRVSFYIWRQNHHLAARWVFIQWSHSGLWIQGYRLDRDQTRLYSRTASSLVQSSMSHEQVHLLCYSTRPSRNRPGMHFRIAKDRQLRKHVFER